MYCYENSFTMRSMTTHIRKKQLTVFPTENKQGIEDFNIAIMQLEEAIKHHQEAVRLFEEGKYYEAYIHTIKAKGHTEHALEIQKEILKEHSIDK